MSRYATEEKIFINSGLLPLDVVDSYWLYEENTLNQTNSDGKWMLYYEKNILMKNGNWQHAYLEKKS